MVGLTRTESLHRLKAQVRVELDAIPDEAMGELASLALGRKAFTPALRQVVTRAGGNPLFLEESLSMLVEAGALVSTPSGWIVADPQMLERVPTTVRAMIAARLDGLPPDEKRLFQCASVSGEITWERLLERLAPGLDVPGLLRSMVSRDLVRRRRGSQALGANEFIFKHALIRDVAYGSLPKSERGHLHREVADWLSHGADMAREPLDDLARNYAEAWRLSRSKTSSTAPDGLARSAAIYLGRWADETMAHQALLAESLYARALEVGDEAPGEVEPELRARHATGRAECLIELGRHHEAREAATYALELAERLDDERLGARALVALGRVESDVGDDVLASDLLDRALASFVSVGDVSGQAWATHRLSEIATKTDYTLALDHLRDAHGLFIAAGDRRGQAIAAQDLAYMLSTIGGAEFHHRYREAKQLVAGEGDLRSRAGLLRTLGYFRYYCGEHADAIAIMREARPIAIAAGDRYAEADSLLIEALAASAARPPKEAERASEDVVAFGREIHPLVSRRSGRPPGPGRAAIGRPARRRPAHGVMPSGARAVRRADGDARSRSAGGGDAARPGSVDAGSGAGRGGATAARASGEHLIEPVGALLIGRASLGSGDPAGAGESLAEAVALARNAGATGTLSVARGAYDQAVLLSGRRPRSRRSLGSGIVFEAIEAENHGLASMMADGNEEAVASFRDAVELWRSLGWTVWLARALAMQGAALRRSGDRRRAAPAFTQARKVLDRLETPAGSRESILAPLGSGWGSFASRVLHRSPEGRRPRRP